MSLSRRDAIRVSGAVLAGVSLRALVPPELLSLISAHQPWPDDLAETPLRERAVLPLNPDRSAPEHSPQDSWFHRGRPWRYTQRQTPSWRLRPPYPERSGQSTRDGFALAATCASRTWKGSPGIRPSTCSSAAAHPTRDLQVDSPPVQRFR